MHFRQVDASGSSERVTRAYPENIFGVPSWDPDYIDQRQAEFDPTGGNVGTISNYQPQYGTVNPDFLPIESESYLFIDGQRVAATLDGMAVSWHMLERMAAAGALTVGTNCGWASTFVEYDILGRAKRSSVPTEVSIPNVNDPESWTPTGDGST
ncbi:MAG: hypothetical protein JNJ39_00660 [Blastocatellia bacterium]|nr:hypothetical protein [Blastocatellia bacterium]